MSDVTYLREQAAKLRADAASMSQDPLAVEMIGADGIAHINERANRYDRAADALALVESAKGAEPFPGGDVGGGAASFRLTVMGHKRALAARLIATAIALLEAK